MLILFRVVIENLFPSEILEKNGSYRCRNRMTSVRIHFQLHESNPKIRNEEVSKSFDIIFFWIILAQSLSCLITQDVNLKFN